MSGVDGVFLPGQGGNFRSAERPERLKVLVQALEGKQVAVLQYLDGVGPTGSMGFGFELTSGERWMVFAGRSADSHKYKAVLAWRKLQTPKIWTPARRRHFASGRDADPLLDKPDELQQRVEGQVIRGLRFAENPTRHGGEEQEIEFSDGSLLILMARPIRKTIYAGDTPGPQVLSADIEYALTMPEVKPRIIP